MEAENTGSAESSAVEVKELQPLTVRKIDFVRFAPAANKAIESLLVRVNELLELSKAQAAEIEELKKK